MWFVSLCWWPLFSLFSGASLYFLPRFSSLDIRLFTYAFSCSLSLSPRCILPILASFLTFLRVFLYSLYTLYFLLYLVTLPLSFQPIFTQNPLYTDLYYNNLLSLKSFSSAGIVALRVDQKLKNTENYYSITTSAVCFPAQNAGWKFFAYAASHLLAHV